jgi:cytochrome c5
MRVDDRLPCALLLAAVLALTLACGDSGGGAPDAAPTPTPDAPKADAPTAPEPAPAPAEPVPAEPAGAPDPVAGEMNYKLYCATCHGEDGCGDGPGAAGLDPKPA